MTRLLYISVLILCIFTSFELYFLSYDSKNIKREISKAVSKYATEVKTRKFPSKKHSFN